MTLYALHSRQVELNKIRNEPGESQSEAGKQMGSGSTKS